MNRPYRILHLIKGLGRGGAEKLLSEGVRYADAEHFQYSYGYFLPWKNALVEELSRLGNEVTCFRAKRPASILLAAGRVAKFLRSSHIDLLHCHLPLAGVVGRVAAHLAGIPIVYTEHNVMERYHPWTRRANVWTWGWQDAAVAVSHHVAESVRSYAGSRLPVHVIHNGVDTEMFKSSKAQRTSTRRSLNIPAGVPLVGNVAAFRKEKNLSDWLKAANIIRQQFPDCHFLLVGDGPLRNQIEEEARTLTLDNFVHFTGVQAEIAPYYSAIDVFMSSSIFEGLPIALLEAMAMNLPVVATSVGGVPEVLQDAQTGFLVSPKQPSLLAQSVCRLLSDNALRSSIGLAARSRVEEHFSLKRMIFQLEQLYQKILEPIRVKEYNQSIQHVV